VAEENGHKTLSEAAYKSLVAAVGRMLAEGEKAGKDADSSRARVNWEIGDKLVEAGLIGRNHYGESILEQLAEDLERDPQTLRRCIVFRRVYDRENLYRSVTRVRLKSIEHQLVLTGCG
jgi:hypothetical protein